MKSRYCTTMQNRRDHGAGPNEPTPSTQKPSLHPKMVILCIWWDWKGVLYYELLLENQTINSNKYCFQLDQLKAALNEKASRNSQQKTHIHQDNARSRVKQHSTKKRPEIVNRKRIYIRITPDHVFL